MSPQRDAYRPELQALPQAALPLGALSSFALAALAYVLAAELGLNLAMLHSSVSPLWPASGVALASLVLLGRRAWAGIAAGAFTANALTGIGLAPAACIAVGNTLEAVFAFWLLLRVTRWRELGSLTVPVGFLVAAALASVAAAVGGVTTLVTFGKAPVELAPAIALTWWSGDAIGALLVAPLLIFAVGSWPQLRALTRPDLLRGVALVASCAAVVSLNELQATTPALGFLALPVVLLATHWFGRFGAIAAAAVFVFARVLHAAHQSFDADTNTALLQLEIFLAAVTFTALLLGSYARAASSAIPAFTLLGGWLLSALLYDSLQGNNARLDQLRMQKVVESATRAIEARLTTYVDALRAGASLYAASASVEHHEWSDFAKSLDMVHRYPGILGIGVIDPVRAQDVDAYIARTIADDQPGFAIRAVPDVEKPQIQEGEPEHFVIRFIEPMASNARAVGLDIGSETDRRFAACVSRDSGEPRITDRIVLVQDGKKRPGFLLYVPMYRKGSTAQTTAERRRDHTGWVYAPFITENFLKGVLEEQQREVDIRFHRGTEADPEQLLFASSVDDVQASQPDQITRLQLGGRPFTIAWHQTRDFMRSSNAAAMLTSASLALVAVLLAGFVLSLQTINRRARDLAAARTQELQTVNERLAEQVSDRERAENEALEARAAAENASRKKSEFLAAMSHEIRTPMNSVIGFTGLLMQSQMTVEQLTWATYIETSGRSLLALINDILDFSKIEAGKLQIENVPYSPELSAREVVGMMMQRADEKGVPLVLEELSVPPRRIIGDPNRFIQILINLISNAIKFTEEGEVRISMTWTARDDDNGTIEVAVVDSGIGIAADKLSQLFQDFTQANSAISRKYGGTGLGLAISRRLVDLMNGRIGVTSKIGVGSRFVFSLDCALVSARAEADSLEHGPAHAEGEGAPAALPPLRILLAEDVVMNQVLARAVLKRHGCSIDIANNGREAIEMSAQASYDVIFMDCQMPEIDGIEATAVIRARETEAGASARVPIVALTANALDGDKERCLAAGMDDYVSKPIRPQDLERSLRRWCTPATTSPPEQV